jgi:hypothetical protein
MQIYGSGQSSWSIEVGMKNGALLQINSSKYRSRLCIEPTNPVGADIEAYGTRVQHKVM